MADDDEKPDTPQGTPEDTAEDEREPDAGKGPLTAEKAEALIPVEYG